MHKQPAQNSCKCKTSTQTPQLPPVAVHTLGASSSSCALALCPSDSYHRSLLPCACHGKIQQPQKCMQTAKDPTAVCGPRVSGISSQWLYYQAHSQADFPSCTHAHARPDLGIGVQCCAHIGGLILQPQECTLTSRVPTAAHGPGSELVS